jgi:hypothetical protein
MVGVRLLVQFLLAVAWAAAAEPVARLEDKAVAESSGMAASLQNAGLYWTHNDSGDGPYLYAFDRQGRSHGRWRVSGATATDWEDIASARDGRSGRAMLYIADIGDNARRRREVTVWRVAEPVVRSHEACRKSCVTAPAAAIRLRYPDGAHNAETLLVHPRSGDLYIVTKAGGPDRDTAVYVARARALRPGRAVALERIATLDVPDVLFTRVAGGVTGGDISPDGRRVALSYYFGLYEAVLPEGERDFDAIWDRPFRHIAIGFGLQVEGVCYRADGKALLATAEGSPAPLFEIADPPR